MIKKRTRREGGYDVTVVSASIMNTLYTIRSFKIILYQNVPPFFSTFVINIVTYNTYS